MAQLVITQIKIKYIEQYEIPTESKPEASIQLQLIRHWSGKQRNRNGVPACPWGKVYFKE
jgi:hypothetical protein